MSFGNRLKSARKNKKLTQAEVAERVGIDDTTLSKYENDRSQPDNETLKKIAELYEVSFDWIYGDKGKTKTNGIDLTEKETKLIERLRKVSEKKRKIVFDMTETWEEQE